jgi:hypothetical protein
MLSGSSGSDFGGELGLEFGGCGLQPSIHVDTDHVAEADGELEARSLIASKPNRDAARVRLEATSESGLALAGCLQVVEQRFTSPRDVATEAIGHEAHAHHCDVLVSTSGVKSQDFAQLRAPLRLREMPRKAERPKTSFGKRLDEACNDIGLSPTRLTAILKMPVGYISEIQRKDGQTISTYPRWAFNMVAILGVRWEWLFYGEEPKHPPSGPSTPQAAGAMIAMVLDAAKHPKKRVAYIEIEGITKEIAASGFVAPGAWEWAEMIRLRLLETDGAKGMLELRKKVERRLEIEAAKGQKKIRRAADKKRALVAEPDKTLPPESQGAASSRRMGRVKTR